MAKLFVDDVRSAPEGWRTARTVAEAVGLLESARFDEVSLDFIIDGRAESNFLPVALCIAALPEERRPSRVWIHTSSEQGAVMMSRVLAGRVKELVRGRP